MGNQKIWMDKVKVMYVDSRTYLATQIVNDADILFDTFVYICDRHEASRSLVYSAHCLCLVPRLDSQNQHPLPKRMQPFYRKSEIWDSASSRPQKECHHWSIWTKKAKEAEEAKDAGAGAPPSPCQARCKSSRWSRVCGQACAGPIPSGDGKLWMKRRVARSTI